jgi:DNA polymerase
MTNEGFTSENIGHLENILRFWGKNKTHFHLQPVDTNLLAQLRNSYGDLQEQTGQQKEKSSGAKIENLTPQPTPPPQQTPPVKEQKLMPFEEAESLYSLRLRVRDCNRCKLCMTRKKVVTGQGNANAKLVFVGEGPGAEEDRSGWAFVGAAGKLLTQIIQSIGISRDSVYICNVVKCRPPGNRNPEQEEIRECLPILLKQIELLKPELIVTLGNVATKALIPKALGIMKMRGKVNYFGDIPLIPTFHPSYLLRNPNAVEAVWNDMRLVRQTFFLKN